MLEVCSLTRTFGPLRAVDRVSFALGEGEIVALLGPSGCGKSTLLALIAGLETPDAGDVRWNGESLAGVPSHRRSFGLMFQDYALFPHKNVAQNVGFGLKMQGLSKASIAAEVGRTLDLVGLAGFEERDVNTLSGGEQQRVALARALAPRPRLLMLDEPLGALDRRLRERLLEELRAILRRLRQTALYVTHDQEEAFTIADRVAVMQAGRVVQVGTPSEVYAHPASRFVAEFLGLTNLVEGRLARRAGATVVVTEIGEIPIAKKPGFSNLPGQAGPEFWSEETVTVLLRPESGTVVEDKNFQIEGKLLEKSFRGNWNVARLEVGQITLTFEFPASQPLPEEGETLRLRLDPACIVV